VLETIAAAVVVETAPSLPLPRKRGREQAVHVEREQATSPVDSAADGETAS
jgi:hypothetical protein